MDADLLPELSGEMWVAATYLEELMTDSEPDFVVASRLDETLSTVRQWIQIGATPAWSECLGFFPELRCWQLQFGNLSVDMEGRLWRHQAPPATSSQLVVPVRERQEMICRYHDSRDIWVCPGLFIAYWVRFIGRAYARTCILIWPAVRSVWPGSRPAHGGLLWDMLQ